MNNVIDFRHFAVQQALRVMEVHFYCTEYGIYPEAGCMIEIPANEKSTVRLIFDHDEDPVVSAHIATQLSSVLNLAGIEVELRYKQIDIDEMPFDEMSSELIDIGLE